MTHPSPPAAAPASAVRTWPPYPTYRDSSVDWLGEIPAHWTQIRLKYCAPASNRKLDEKPAELPYLGLENVESKTGQLLLETSVETVESTVTIFEPGDVLFGKLRPYLAKVALPDFPGVCTTELIVLQPHDQTDGKFLYYLLLSENLIGFIDSLTYGTKMPRVSPDQIGNLTIPQPPLPEQRAIAAFLDRETARIDALVAKKERLIALLQEKRAALISHAVTRGLDPAAPMRDSGVPWLGMVPAHWQLVPLRRAMRAFVDYRGATPNKVSNGIPLVTARNIKNGTIDFSASQEFIREDDYASWMVRGLPETGDVLVTTEAPLGESTQITDTNIALAQRVILLKADKSLVSNEYLKYYFASHAGSGELWSRATGSTAIGIKASHLREVLMPVPPLAEQRAIATILDRETTRIDALAGKVQQQIEQLKEYRAALISAAVTGKIDVRGNTTLEVARG